MTQVGSSYATVKRGFLDLLQARPGLAEAAIQYHAPTDPASVTGPTGKHEAIYYVDDDTDEGVQENVIICSIPLQVDESYQVPLVVQVMVPETSDGETSTQELADRRVDEMLGEVFGAMANNPALGPGVDAPFGYLAVTRATFTRRTGIIGQAAGHASSALVRLQVEARLAPADET